MRNVPNIATNNEARFKCNGPVVHAYELLFTLAGFSSLFLIKRYDRSHCAVTMVKDRRNKIRGYDYTPVRRKTVAAVFARIYRSSQSDQLSMYSRSRATQSSKSAIRFRPITCHKQVIPGLTLSLRRCQISKRSNSHGPGGRGTTRLMSPTSALHSCGSSSWLYLRRNRLPVALDKPLSAIRSRNLRTKEGRCLLISG